MTKTSETYEHLFIFLNTIHVGCARSGFQFTMPVPAGRFPVILHRRDGVPGRLTVILDPQNVEESFAEQCFEPLVTLEIEAGAILVAGDAARALWERGDFPIDSPSLVLDETGANVICLPLKEATDVEVAWWYGGDEEAEHEGICALDLLWDRQLDPVSADSPVRNMETLIQEFFNEHGPPSLRSNVDDNAEEEDQ